MKKTQLLVCSLLSLLLFIQPIFTVAAESTKQNVTEETTILENETKNENVHSPSPSSPIEEETAEESTPTHSPILNEKEQEQQSIQEKEKVNMNAEKHIESSSPMRYKMQKKRISLPSFPADTAPEVIQKLKELQKLTFVTPYSLFTYEVALAYSDGSFETVADSATNDLQTAIVTANNLASQYEPQNIIPTVLTNNGFIAYATKAMARVVKVRNGSIYPATNVTSNVYTTSTGSTAHTYVNHGYVEDLPVLQDNGKRAQVIVNGYKGWMDKDTLSNEFDLLIVPFNQAKNPSYYSVDNTGVLQHFISSNLQGTSGYTIKIGKAPSYLSKGTKYYSYDGHYFYRSLDDLLTDEKVGSRSHSINQAPFYNYYQYLPFRSQTNYTPTEINEFIHANAPSTSVLKNSGSHFIEAQNKYGINALLAIGIAINESAWGNSNLAKTKNNIFGLNALDSNFGASNSYNSIRDCILDFAKNWISKGYVNPSDWRYFGGHIGNKNLGANVKYASDPFWGEKAAQYAFHVDLHLSGNNVNTLKDYDLYDLALLNSSFVMKNNSFTTLYGPSLSGSYRYGKVSTPIIVLNNKATTSNDGTKWYTVQPDRNSSMSSTFDGTYNIASKGYVETNKVTFINNRSAKNVPLTITNEVVNSDVEPKLEGVTSPNSSITATLSSGRKVSGKSYGAGTFSISLSGETLKAGEKISAQATDVASNSSVNVTTTIKKGVTIADTFVEDIHNEEQYIDITAPSIEAGATIEATWGTERKTTTVKSDGSAVINLGGFLPSGTVVTFKITSIRTNETITIQKNVHWIASTNQFEDVHNKEQYVDVVTSPSEVGAKAFATWNGKTRSATIKADGTAAINLGDFVPAGTKINFYIQNSLGSKSPTITKTIHWIASTNQFENVNNKEKLVDVVTSPSEVGAKAFATWNGKTRSATIKADGTVSINLKEFVPEETKINFYIQNSLGSKSPTVVKTVIKR